MHNTQNKAKLELIQKILNARLTKSELSQVADKAKEILCRREELTSTK